VYIAAAVLLLLFALMFFFGPQKPTLTGDEARNMVAQGALLLDVRTPPEFSQGHVAAARNIPVADLAARADTLGKKDQAIVVYCQSGARSGQAVKILERSGFTSVHNLGAIGRWTG
jgi:phage shock protein E